MRKPGFSFTLYAHALTIVLLQRPLICYSAVYGVKKMTVSIIGCGNMGGAIAGALREKEEFTLTGYDIDLTKVERLSIACASSAEDAIKASEIIVLAVKPQIIPQLYDIISEYNEKSYISILAGVPLEVLEYRLDADNIARFMPNLAAGARKAVTAIAYSQSASEAFRKAAFDIASAFGSAFILPEKMFPAFIGLSGSGIAYVFQFVHALAMGAVEEGIPYTRAVEIAGDTLESAFTLLRDSRKNPVELASMVCSAGGTTIRGMNILSEQGFDNAVIKAVRGATERSIELEKSALESKEND